MWDLGQHSRAGTAERRRASGSVFLPSQICTHQPWTEALVAANYPSADCS